MIFFSKHPDATFVVAGRTNEVKQSKTTKHVLLFDCWYNIGRLVVGKRKVCCCLCCDDNRCLEIFTCMDSEVMKENANASDREACA